jgi:hypothetical protein
LLVGSGSSFLDPRFGCFIAGRFVLGFSFLVSLFLVFSFLEQSVVSRRIPACPGLRVTGYGLRVTGCGARYLRVFREKVYAGGNGGEGERFEDIFFER